jgi:uncharacterized protein
MNKTALITGASNGIGYELSKIHAENGDNLILVARNKSKLDELKNELEAKHGITVHTIGKDLSVISSAREIFDEIQGKNITVNYLINNAGVGCIGLFADCDLERQEKMINLNIVALTQLTRFFLTDMIKQRSGRIMNVASTAAFQPGPTMAVYFATKAYVLSFSQALNNEVRDKGLTVTALCPGSTESGFHAAAISDNRELKERRLPSSRQVAEYGYNAMMKGRAIAIPGLKNQLMAASVRFFPRSLVVNAARRIQENKH